MFCMDTIDVLYGYNRCFIADTMMFCIATIDPSNGNRCFVWIQ